MTLGSAGGLHGQRAPDIIRWYEEVMADPAERERTERVVALARQSHGDLKTQRQLTTKAPKR